MSKEFKHISTREIEEMEKRYRVNFINSLPGFKSLNLIGTVNRKGDTNLSIVSTVTHFGSNPPLIGYISRPESPERHTLSNILETGSYTINQVSESFFKEAHQTSARYPAEISEFESVGLTPVWRKGLPIPFVAESAVTMHLSLVEKVDIQSNGTVLTIGQVTDVFLDHTHLMDDGNIDLEVARIVTGAGLDGYFLPQKLARLSYAKTDRPISEI